MDLLLVGRIARAHGNRGQVIVNPETDFVADRFKVGNVLLVEHQGQTAERRIVEVRFQQGRPIVALSGVETMNDAEALAGAALKVPALTVAPLPDGMFYRHDLVGCDVKDTAGRAIGRVTAVEGPLDRSLLVVGEGRDEVMIPMVEGIVVGIDAAARQVIVELPEGLVGLNRSPREGE